jgi:2-oxoglutarate ferredoxin oxidoreductase subunit delta
MSKIKYDSSRCKGCYYCVNACPKKAITITDALNSKGYNIVAFNEDECISCGSCYRVCPDYAIEIL